MNIATRTSFLALALVASAASAAVSQNAEDPRWTAWLGCWDPVVRQGPEFVRAEAPRVCILPVAGSAAVELVTLRRDSIVSRQRLDASGERHDAPRDGCTGFERGTFSATGTRVYLRAEHTCPGASRARVATALMSIVPGGEWLDVQGVGTGPRAAVRVTRYQAVRSGAAVPDSIAQLLSGRAFAISTARASAGDRVRVPDVIEANREVGGDVVEAWVTEMGDDFQLDGRTLTELADAGVPGNVTDIMVALSYPRTFTVRENRGGAAPRERTRERVSTETAFSYPYDTSPYAWGYYGGYDAWYSPYDRYGYGRYGYGYPYGPGGYGYGYGGIGYYNRPVIIVVGGGTGSSQQPGRVVNGRGYRAGEGAPSSNTARNSGSSGGASASSGRDSGGNSGSSGAGSSSGTATSGGYGSGGSGTDTGRTAKPRP